MNNTRITKSQDTFFFQLPEILGHHPQYFTDDYTVAQRAKYTIQGKKYNLPLQELEGKSSKPSKHHNTQEVISRRHRCTQSPLSILLRDKPRPSTTGCPCGALAQGLHCLVSLYILGEHESGLISRCKQMPGNQAIRVS